MAATDTSSVSIPADLRPADGRFAAGPSKVRREAVAALADAAAGYLGTSHRQASVRREVARLREGLAELFGLPHGYEVVLGLGGATLLWDAIAFCLIERRSEHLVFGEFSAKCANSALLAPHISDPHVVKSEPGTHPDIEVRDDVDLYALIQNETSTGVAMPVSRPPGDALVAVDAVSAAGGMPVDAEAFDFYYFSPQKAFGSDGGLWWALCSPAALERIERLAAERYVPPSLDLQTAVENSRKDQTYNTPALATLFLMREQVDWMLANGGLTWASGRSARSSQILYEWADAHPLATPFVADPAQRSPVVVTIDFHDPVDAAAIAGGLRANGILDTEPYRKLGRNQLRIATYPAIEPSDVEQLTRCIDYLIDASGSS